MKFEKLTNTKIKIIISQEDLKLNNLSIDNILSNSISSQKLLNNIILNAEKELNFKTDNSDLLVETVILNNSECIFTISKLLDNPISDNRKNNLLVYEFNSFDDFIKLCHFLQNFSFLCLNDISKSFSLILYNNTYFLKLIEFKNFFISTEFIKTFFDEFGEDVSNRSAISGKLSEYGKIIFSQNAILNCLNSFK